jgi:hypothetical protein
MRLTHLTRDLVGNHTILEQVCRAHSVAPSLRQSRVVAGHVAPSTDSDSALPEHWSCSSVARFTTFPVGVPQQSIPQSSLVRPGYVLDGETMPMLAAHRIGIDTSAAPELNVPM